MTPELRDALDNAYEVFARYDAPDYLGLNGNFQLRDLTIASWHQFNENHDMGVLMFSDNGELSRYFLPRWLEWLSKDESNFWLGDWELWSLGNRLVLLGWQKWPVPEVASVRQIFEVWAREEIVNHGGMPECENISMTLTLASNSGENMGVEGFDVGSAIFEFVSDAQAPEIYLEIWLDTNLPQLARWLWTENWHLYKIERQWITSSRLENELEYAFFAAAGGPNAELFSRSIELVRSLREV